MANGEMTARPVERISMKKLIAILCFGMIAAGSGCQTQSTPREPVIGITSVYKRDKQENSASTLVNFAYVRAVAENGGVPVILPTIDSEVAMQRYVRDLDGLVLVGGADIPPSAYGQQPHETVEPLPAQRYEFERKLIALWLAGGKPVLGICLGMQFTNVVSGGTLIQDIPSQVGTEVKHRGYHRVHIEPGSSLAKILGAGEASVYSNHHQAVREVGDGLKVVAHSNDGVVEALERLGEGFGLFVQWHPEQMDDKQHRDAIYGALVRASAPRPQVSPKD
ncbi:MAG: gamma-glutamyl-gamma-aminobutyrate hydrolase family protein [Phycisphaerales bacterium]|nr:MAG: gamma-glutamyl-gamma-aminobutyrate hydrolase family protein [Phycisphaerales bacterium]